MMMVEIFDIVDQITIYYPSDKQESTINAFTNKSSPFVRNVHSQIEPRQYKNRYIMNSMLKLLLQSPAHAPLGGTGCSSRDYLLTLNWLPAKPG